MATYTFCQSLTNEETVNFVFIGTLVTKSISELAELNINSIRLPLGDWILLMDLILDVQMVL